jgi:hypothetical protein
MSQKEDITPEEFTKKISPTKEGIRASIEKTGHINYVHKWMQEYSDLQNKALLKKIESRDKEIKELKTIIEGLYEDKAGADI